MPCVGVYNLDDDDDSNDNNTRMNPIAAASTSSLLAATTPAAFTPFASSFQPPPQTATDDDVDADSQEVAPSDERGIGSDDDALRQRVAAAAETRAELEPAARSDVAREIKAVAMAVATGVAVTGLGAGAVPAIVLAGLAMAATDRIANAWEASMPWYTPPRVINRLRSDAAWEQSYTACMQAAEEMSPHVLALAASRSGGLLAIAPAGRNYTTMDDVMRDLLVLPTRRAMQAPLCYAQAGWNLGVAKYARMQEKVERDRREPWWMIYRSMTTLFDVGIDAGYTYFFGVGGIAARLAESLAYDMSPTGVASAVASAIQEFVQLGWWATFDANSFVLILHLWAYGFATLRYALRLFGYTLRLVRGRRAPPTEGVQLQRRVKRLERVVRQVKCLLVQVTAGVNGGAKLVAAELVAATKNGASDARALLANTELRTQSDVRDAVLSVLAAPLAEALGDEKEDGAPPPPPPSHLARALLGYKSDLYRRHQPEIRTMLAREKTERASRRDVDANLAALLAMLVAV